MSSSQAPSVFSGAMEAFKKRLSAQDLEAFEVATFDGLKSSVYGIQKRQQQRQGFWNLNNIRPILNGLQGYARVIEQFVSAKPAVLALIWVSRIHQRCTVLCFRRFALCG